MTMASGDVPMVGTDVLTVDGDKRGTVRLNIKKDRLGEAKDEGRREHRGVHPHDTTVV